MNHRRLENVSKPFFVTNFPPDADVKSLWEECDKVGNVVDIYIARKLSKIGKRFAFVRFIKVKDDLLLEQKLRDIWMGSYHLFAYVARFSRDVSNTGGLNKKEKAVSHNSVEYNVVKQVKKLNVHAVANYSSYANVLKGQGVEKTNNGPVPECIL
ncbi:unnamed protein product [Lactuca virosa]|uniref:RRM domain-containing protein n=1 Tax=Lactuca virosa TaxID=75947 RepID=A0AAU9NG24_9ASTR|nr:unnamed protein product [Lactuca virosa]